MDTVWFINIVQVEDVLAVKSKYPDYKLLVHPECDPQIIKYADLVISTGGMVDWVKITIKQ